ncbi:MAG: hypothetical protein IJR53_11180 [Bacteroidales bacterium]|nr:hypothetical protein [Bacteroidales bacterium]
MEHTVPGVSPLAIPGALPLSMVFSALRALLRPDATSLQLHTNGRMPTAAVIRQPYIMCPCHVRADADACDASLYVMPYGIRT